MATIFFEQSIVYRVAVPMLAGTILAGLLLVVVVPAQQHAALETSVESELQSLSAALAVSAQLAFSQQDLRALSNLNKLLTEDQRGLQVAVFVGSEDSEEILATFPEGDTLASSLSERADRLLMASSPFETAFDQGRVVVIYEKSKLRVQTTLLNLPLYFSLMALILIQVWIYNRLRITVVQPLISVAGLADELGAGQYDQRLPKVYRGDEVGLLQRALRTLRTRLRLERRQNNRLMESLESEVERRTLDLRRAMAAKDTFMAGVSHELRTPLHSVLATLDLIATDSPLNGTQKKNIQLARRGANTLMQLINELLDFQRLSNTDIELHNQPLQLKSFLEEVGDVARVLFEESALAFTMRCEVEPHLWVQADSQRITQVILNLVGNARKFTETGSVTLAVSACEGEETGVAVVGFSVTDTGRGMEAPTVARLGEEFFQGDSGLARKHEGTGLGISIVTRILAAMGARLKVDSEPGLGSQFQFELLLPRTDPVPLAPSGRPHTTDAAHAGEVFSAAKPFNVLYVEDSEMNQMVMTALCDRFPIALRICSDAVSGYEAIKSQRYDLIITDIQMPDYSGFDLLYWCLDDPGVNAQVPRIACTANATLEAQEQFDEAGFDGVLTKPLTLDDMVRFFAQCGVEPISAPPSMGQ